MVGRLLLSAIFLMSGANKVFNASDTLGYMKAKMPVQDHAALMVLLVAAVVCELAGGLSVLLGWKAKWGAGLLILFLVPTTIFFHNFWAVPQEQQLTETMNFVKNLAILGGLLMVNALGPGPCSMDHGWEAFASRRHVAVNGPQTRV
jgi:putative oxidoreductase